MVWECSVSSFERGLERLGETEVEDLGLAVGGQPHVGRLEVAVDHAPFVRRFQSPGNLQRQGQRRCNGDRTTSDPVGEVFSLDEFHDEERDRS